MFAARDARAKIDSRARCLLTPAVPKQGDLARAFRKRYLNLLMVQEPYSPRPSVVRFASLMPLALLLAKSWQSLPYVRHTSAATPTIVRVPCRWHHTPGVIITCWILRTMNQGPLFADGCDPGGWCVKHTVFMTTGVQKVHRIDGDNNTQETQIQSKPQDIERGLPCLLRPQLLVQTMPPNQTMPPSITHRPTCLPNTRHNITVPAFFLFRPQGDLECFQKRNPAFTAAPTPLRCSDARNRTQYPHV